MKLNRENNAMFDLCVCELFSMRDNSKLFDGIDVGKYNSIDWLRFARAAAGRLFDDIERRYPDASDGSDLEIDWMYEICENGEKFLSQVVNPEQEHEFALSVNAFMWIKVKGATRDDAHDKLCKMIDNPDFVREHYTEFELDNEVVICEDW